MKTWSVIKIINGWLMICSMYYPVRIAIHELVANREPCAHHPGQTPQLRIHLLIGDPLIGIDWDRFLFQTLDLLCKNYSAVQCWDAHVAQDLVINQPRKTGIPTWTNPTHSTEVSLGEGTGATGPMFTHKSIGILLESNLWLPCNYSPKHSHFPKASKSNFCSCEGEATTANPKRFMNIPIPFVLNTPQKHKKHGLVETHIGTIQRVSGLGFA